ncbi:diguanylate cyclase [Fusibacter sp. JL216-2]|uniref:diguanylate cyclase n=1 Tax=Fusibacter sp. JL216-2 TaxID=3071453 RepID=UPI003D357767
MSIKKRLFIAFLSIMVMIGIFGVYMSLTIQYMNRMNRTNDQIVDIQSEVNYSEISQLKYVSSSRREDALDVFYHRGSLVESIELIQDAYISKEQLRIFNIILEDLNRYEDEFTQMISLTDQMLALKNSIESDMNKLSDSLDSFDQRQYPESDKIVWALRKRLIGLYNQYFSVNNMLSETYTNDWDGMNDIIEKASALKHMDSLPIEYQVMGLRIEVLLKSLNENMYKLIDKRKELEVKSVTLSSFTEGTNIDIERILDIQKTRIEDERKGLLEAFNVTLVLMIVLCFVINFYLSKYINRNMNALIRITERISAGEYSMRVPQIQSDEFAKLGDAINKMAESLLNSTKALMKSNTDLEGLVEVRTIELNKANAKLAQANEALEEEKERLVKLARTDGLTGLDNRRNILDYLEEQINQAKRYDRPVTIMMADIDHFKRINDTYGHTAGDEVLKKLASVFRSSIRETDRVGRFGGEEFLFVFTGTSQSETKSIIERVRNKIKGLDYSFGKTSITVSAGVCQYEKGSSTIFIGKADKLMYEAKEKGRNQVVYDNNIDEA